MSGFCLPVRACDQDTTITGDDLVTAPRLDHHRTKVEWTEEGIEEYSALISNQLRNIRNIWLDHTSQVSMSILFQLTNSAMSIASTATNTTKSLGRKPPPRKQNIPLSIRRAQNKLHKSHKRHKAAPSASTEHFLRLNRKSYHRTVRVHNMISDLGIDKQLYSIMGGDPSKVFSFIRSTKRIQNQSVEKLTVGQRVYCGEKVADGFYDFMSSLKQCDPESLKCIPELSEKFSDYDLIIKICQDHQVLPSIDLDKSTKLLNKIKKNVKDHFSITSKHYINAGEEGLLHFNILLNNIIADVNNAGLEELNRAHALIYYKGHHKQKSSDRSYRNISSCPFLSKALDMYICDLYLDLWQKQQADTQYEGPGSTHELASLLLTEVIQYSLHTANKPVYLLALDAQSAFDRCLRQVLASELYKSGMPAATILIIDKRLASRTGGGCHGTSYRHHRI